MKNLTTQSIGKYLFTTALCAGLLVAPMQAMNQTAAERAAITTIFSGTDFPYELNRIVLDYLQEWQPTHTLNGHAGYVSSAAFNRDGTKIVSASYDHTVKVWDLTAATPTVITLRDPALGNNRIHAFYYGKSAAFNRDGTKIVSASQDQTVKVWEFGPGPEERAMREAGKKSRSRKQRKEERCEKEKATTAASAQQ